MIELLVALVIAAILMRYATAYLPDWLNQRRANTGLQGIHAALNTARHAAIRHASVVIVCPRRNDRGATPGCGARNTWHQGLLAYLDANRNRVYDASDNVIASIPGPETGQITWRSFRNRSYLRFTPRGLTDWQNGHFLFCPENADPRLARQLVLNMAGRIYPSRDRDGDGIHEDAAGNPLRCG